MNVINDRVIPIAEVREILKKKEKSYNEEEKELYYEQKRALEHANSSAKLKLTDINKVIEEIKGLDLQLTPEQIVKMADILPETVDDVRAIFAKERFKYTEEEITKILDVIAKYR